MVGNEIGRNYLIMKMYSIAVGKIKNNFPELKIFSASKNDINNIYFLWNQLLSFHRAKSLIFKNKQGVCLLNKKDIGKMISNKYSAKLFLENGEGNFIIFSFMKILIKRPTFKFSHFGYKFFIL